MSAKEAEFVSVDAGNTQKNTHSKDYAAVYPPQAWNTRLAIIGRPLIGAI